MTRLNLAPIALFLLGCVAGTEEGRRRDGGASVPPPSLLRPSASISTNLHTRLVENSVAVTSVTQPGIIYGVNDSGHDALLFAFDSTGRHRGIWRVNGARNLDWEAATTGPCAGSVGTRDCLFIGDIGDNSRRRSSVTVYRLPEPRVTQSSPDLREAPDSTLPAADRITVTYPDQPHDVEAMYAHASGDLFLLTKRPLLDAARRPRPALVYRIPAAAWSTSGTVMAELVDSLPPIVPGQNIGSQITDAALSADGKRLAVRTYAEVFVFDVDSATGRPSSGREPAVCPVLHLNEKQGEGIGWWWDAQRVVLTSEGGKEPLWVIECSDA